MMRGFLNTTLFFGVALLARAETKIDFQCELRWRQMLMA